MTEPRPVDEGAVAAHRAAVLRDLGMCEFDEDVNDGSMCLCGLPALDHDALATRVVLGDHPGVAALLDGMPHLLAAAEQRGRAAIDRVRRLHGQYSALGLAPGEWCPGCGFPEPCPTVLALNAPTAPGCCPHCNHGPGFVHTVGCDAGCAT